VPQSVVPPDQNNSVSVPNHKMSGSASGTTSEEPRISGNSWFPDIPRILPHEKAWRSRQPAE